MGGRGAKSSIGNIKDRKEYKHFVDSYRNPDSVAPMIEWSTDWEGLREKYKNSEFGRLISEEEYIIEQYDKSAKRLNYVNSSEARDEFEYWSKEKRNIQDKILKYKIPSSKTSNQKRSK